MTIVTWELLLSETTLGEIWGRGDCPYGKDIKSWHRVSGEGNRPRCDECKKLG